MTLADRADGFDLLLIDGDNVLHQVRGQRDEGGVAWLLPRLSRWRPAGMHIIVTLDGHPAPGESRRRRVTTGIEFHHSGSGSADDLIIELLGSRPYASRARTVVVTRDRDLVGRVRRAGGMTRTVGWLQKELETGDLRPVHGSKRGRAVGIGQAKPPPRAETRMVDPDGADREPWRPGRGATRKRGNARRSPKSSRRR